MNSTEPYGQNGNYQQPPPPAPPQSNIGTVIVVLVIVGIIALGIVALAFVDIPTDGGSNEVNGGSGDTPAGDDTPGDSSTSYDIGEVVEKNKQKVNIKSLNETDYFIWYSDYGGAQIQTPDMGNKYVIIEVEVTNLDDTTIYAYAGDFWMLDSENVKTTYSMDTIYHNDYFEPMTLNKDQKNVGFIVFEIPEDLEQVKIQYDFGDIYDSDIGTWEISLNP